jgi:hypothetical protein
LISSWIPIKNSIRKRNQSSYLKAAWKVDWWSGINCGHIHAFLRRGQEEHKKRTWLNFTLSFFSYKNNNSGCKIQVAWLENGCMGSIRLSHLLIFQDIHVRHLPLSPAGSHATTAFNSADFSNPYIYIYIYIYIFVYVLLYRFFQFYRRQDPSRGHGH